MNKTNFDNKLTSFNRQINLIETKKLEVQKKLNSLITNDYNFFLGTIYFISNYRSQNTFLLSNDTWRIRIKKNTKLLIMFLVGNQREYLILILSHYILLPWIA